MSDDEKVGAGYSFFPHGAPLDAEILRLFLANSIPIISIVKERRDRPEDGVKKW